MKDKVPAVVRVRRSLYALAKSRKLRTYAMPLDTASCLADARTACARIRDFTARLHVAAHSTARYRYPGCRRAQFLIRSLTAQSHAGTTNLRQLITTYEVPF
jgi:hypothetical protein